MSLEAKHRCLADIGVEADLNTGAVPAISPDVEAEIRRVLTRTTKKVNPNGMSTVKTLSQGILDLTLLANHLVLLRRLLAGEKDHQFQTTLLVLIAISIPLQVVSGVLLLIMALGNLNNELTAVLDRMTKGIFKRSRCPFYFCYYSDAGCRCVRSRSRLSWINVVTMFLLLLVGVLNVVVVVLAE